VKILSVSHFFESHGGGLERVAAQLNREFSRAGHEAIWAASGSESIDHEFSIVPLKCFDPAEALTGLPMPIPGLGAIGTLRRAVRACDAIVIHDSLYFTSILAALLAKQSGKPVVLIQHIADIGFRNPVMRVLMRVANWVVTRPMMTAANHLVFISDQVRQKLLGDAPRRQFTLLHNGVDTSLFFPAIASSRSIIRSRHGIRNDAVVLLFVGRFVEKKGLAILRAVARRRPDLHFVLVGSGPISPEIWALPNVQALGPQLQPVVAELYRAVDLLFLPSVGEGFPLVVQEAMASGVPIVCGEDSAAADPDASRWLRGVEIDLTDEAGSASRCDAVITQLLKSPMDTVQMARYAADAYSWNRMAKQIAGLLHA
jgi:alpha-maltose-1-phosphate synthase